MRRLGILATVMLGLCGLYAQTVLGDAPGPPRWTFDAGTDAWTGDDAACTVSNSSPNPGHACDIDNEWRSDGALWTALTGNPAHRASGHATWRSPAFALEDVAGFEVRLLRLPRLGHAATAVSEVRLVDAQGAVTSLAIEEVERGAKPQSRQYAAPEELPAGDYRLEIATSLAGEGAVGYDDVDLLIPVPEPTPSPTPAPAAPPPPPRPEPEPEPELGRTARLTPIAGRVLVGDDQRPLESRRVVPVGTRIDAEAGRVLVEVETTGADSLQFGRLMQAEFHQGAFTVHQSRTASLTELHLDDAPARARARSRGRARSAAKTRTRGKRSRRVKRLWGKGKGRFRTVGRYSAATVRGTEWLVEERKAGTLVRVVEGELLAEEFATGRTKVLQAGESFLGRPPCLSRRRFWIRLRIPAGTIVRDASVRTHGRRAPVRLGARPTALVDLRGIPRGNVKVRIRVTTADGRTLTGTRSYRTCSKPRPSRGVPTL